MKHGFIILLFSTVAFSQWNIISPSVGLDHSYRDVHFINADTGFVVGGILGDGSILRTLNGGLSWDTTKTIEVNGIYDDAPYAIVFPTNEIGYVIGSGEIYKTINCGENWFVVDTSNVYSSPVAPDIIFVNKDTGFCGYADGGAACYRTYDGGWTWTPDPILLGVRNFNCYNGNFFAGTSGWAYLDLSTLTWQSYDNNITSYYHYVNTMIFNGRVIVIGDKMGGSSYGVYAYSDDMGVNWTINYVNPGRLKNITILNDTLWQMCGILDGTLRSFDAGTTWHYTTVDNMATGMFKWFSDFCFVNDSVGYAVSQNGIYKTTNGGGASIGNATFFPPDLGTNEINFENLFSVYPNPVQNEINFNSFGIKVNQLNIYSIDGKEVFNQQIENQNSVDVSYLPGGVYVVKAISHQGIFTEKILKE